MIFLTAVLLLCGLRVMPDAESILIGSLEPCSNEGEIVNVETIKDIRCFTCMCKNGFVECLKEHCPSQQGCYMLLDEPKDSCCRKCKGCIYEGEYHESGTEWKDPYNPCKVLSCKAGVVTESEITCYTPCRHSLPPLPGQCCPTCPGCKINGQVVTEERNVMLLEDPCLKCRCDGGRMTCSKKACPVLHCPASAMIRQPGDCCPTCNGSRRLMEPPKGSCLLGRELHPAGQTFHEDRCTVCSCLNGTSVCHRSVCPVLTCPSDRQIHPPGCCPHCPLVLPVNTSCTVGGVTYKDGETWQLDQCKSCVCHEGQVRCAMEMCPQLNVPCPPNFHLMRDPGQCCPRCVESDGVCTVFGDPHYRTFDGKFFSFQGSCKYQLAADCVDHSFSIRVTNDARSTKTSSWTKTVSLKVGELKINLGEKQRVKVNGQKVIIPYYLDGEVTITRVNEVLHVETQLGVKVVWDGNSFVEVSVPARFKGKLCGLCGNYNSVSRDDLTTKRGRVVLDPEKFGASWRVGGKKACTRLNDPPPRTVQCNQHLPHRRFRDRLCKPLRSDIFAPCHKKLNYSIYFKSCLLDMCECPNRQCYCESFTAYAHECQRLGVMLPDWRKATGCHSLH
ncbi:crosveinless 2-secreting protein [Lycorma delicatula]|uniref:crosveinless 2-secreting protein n=1 Tax=Lycorma delicatula TaxID=130591 RepID=UPI003F512FF1